MLRRVITATAALLVALSLAAFAGSAAYPLDVLSSFRFHLVPVAGLLVVLALVVRARWATGLALLALGINGIVVLPLYTGDQPRPAGRTVSSSPTSTCRGSTGTSQRSGA